MLTKVEQQKMFELESRIKKLERFIDDEPKRPNLIDRSSLTETVRLMVKWRS